MHCEDDINAFFGLRKVLSKMIRMVGKMMRIFGWDV